MGIRAGTRFASVFGLILLLAACGGGDDGGAAPTSSQQPSTGAEESPGAGDDDSSSAKNAPPTINGAPPPEVLHDDTYSFQPEAHDPDGDVLSFSVANAPHWTQFEPTTGRLEGTPAAGDVGTYENIVISVTDGAADASLDAFSITVTATASGSMELSWMAPTENEDGSPLTDLTGYKIYWGTEPGRYTESVTIDNPSVLTYVLDNLVPNTYYFVATAFNSAGEESQYSEEAVGTVS